MMLNREDRDAIEGLFERLENIERTSPARDSEAEALIRERLRQTPAAPYYMAQTILVQEHALSLAERKMEKLEADLARMQASGSLSGDQGQRAGRGPWGRRDGHEDRTERGSGGFLAGAAQTAMGVTGGLLLGTAIASMFGGGSAQAQESNEPEQPADNQDQDADMGDDDGGDFDMGGEF